MKVATLKYMINQQLITMLVADHGDIIFMFVNGRDVSQNGDAIDAALALIAEVGVDIQSDISAKFARETA